MTKRASDNRSPLPLRREAHQGSYQGVTSPECVNWGGDDRAWNQNFTNAGNEGNQNANNKTNTNKSVRPVRRLSPTTANLTIEEVITAYEDCRRYKRNKPTTIDFECDFAHNIMDIFERVTDLSWKPIGHMCFVVRSPKVREVWASPFSDRVVHHIVYNRLRPRFEPGFIATTFACIPNRGTGPAGDWAEKAARKVTQGWSRPAYVLQADIANFFPSINAYRLCNTLLEKSPEPWLANLVKQIILVNVKENAYFPGDPTLFDFVPKHKSLWHKPRGVGLPIGNLTSQFGANVDMDPVDQSFVRGKPVAQYGRYVDDIVMLDTNKETLEVALDKLAQQLEGMGLGLNMSKTTIRPTDHGFDFCGRFIKPHRTYLRRATVRRGNKAMQYLKTSEHPSETATSYLALARHCDAYNLRCKWGRMANEAGLKTDSQLTKAIAGGFA